MLGPGDLIRLPADTIAIARRLLDEVVAMRLLLEHVSATMDTDLEELKREFAHVRERVDEIADAIPTATRGPIEKVRDALSPE